MGTGLINKIGKGIVLPLVFALSGCGVKTYEIDGNKVKNNSVIWNSIVENKGDTLEIKYSLKFGLFVDNNIKSAKINGIKYNNKDSLVYEVANEHYHYLKGEIDKRKESKKFAKEQEKVMVKKEKINFGLKAFE